MNLDSTDSESDVAQGHSSFQRHCCTIDPSRETAEMSNFPMKVQEIPSGARSIDALRRVERPDPEPGRGQVMVRVRATSLNYRDQAVITGNYFGGVVQQDIIPLSDGAGEVVAVGPGVTLLRLGDRVAGTFFLGWTDGPPRGPYPARGAPPADGMLAEYVLLDEQRCRADSSEPVV